MSTLLLFFKNFLPNLRPYHLARCLVICMCFGMFSADAQHSKNIEGKVTDAKTGEPIPYVTLYVKIPNQPNKAVTSNFDGLYHIEVPASADTLYITYMSYLPAKKSIPRLPEIREFNFQLTQDVKLLNEVRITPKSYINPAWEIMAQVTRHKDQNNLEKLKSYQFESYNRVAVSMTNLSDKLKNRKIMRKMLPLMDSLRSIAGDKGTPILPIFMSETISDVYHQVDPDQKTERVRRTRVNGVGIEDGTLISQIVSAGFQQYNFYKNYLRLAGKDFISPLTDSWKLFYDYELVERNDNINGSYYYKIAFKPKRTHDLSFTGVMWITQDSYALYRMDASLSPDANIDFLDKIRIQQEMTQPDHTDAWIPALTRVVINVNNLIKSQSGFIGQFYISNRDFEINKTYPADFFKEPLTINDDAEKKDEAYWVKNRRDSLTNYDRRIYQTIDTVKNLPIVKSYADLIGMLINGYYRVGKFSFGPYLYTYSYNDLQGSVFRIGGTTNRYFSNKVILGGFVSYGIRDREVIFNGFTDYIVGRKPWTQFGISYSHDIGQTGYQFENFSNSNNVFKASMRNGNVTRRGPFLQNEAKTYFQTDLTSHLRAKLTLLHRTFDPLFTYNYIDPVSLTRYRDYEVSEIATELQWTPGRRQLQSGKINKRILLGNGEDHPVITFRYTHGLKAVRGDFDYNKFSAHITQKVHMGIWGKGEYAIAAGYIPAALPHPLLENHRYNFNTMRFLEFTSDKYISLNYTQHMDGLITNSLPMLNKLNLRTVADLNILYGGLSNDNNTRPIRGVRLFDRSLGDVPYLEVGYGVENVLKFFRFDFLYRLNHTDHLDQDGQLPSRFALRTSIQFRL